MTDKFHTSVRLYPEEIEMLNSAARTLGVPRGTIIGMLTRFCLPDLMQRITEQKILAPAELPKRRGQPPKNARVPA